MQNALATAAIVLTFVVQPAEALPLDPVWSGTDDPHVVWNQFAAFVGQPIRESLRYDSTLERLSYVAPGENVPYFNDSRETYVEFDSLLTFEAGINKRGAVTDRGSMQWFGDFGQGFEILATGSIRDIGFLESGQDHPLPDGSPVFIFYSLQVLFDVDFLHPRVVGMGRNMLLMHEQQWMIDVPTPFFESFTCPNRDPPALPSCNHFSDSSLRGVTLVPEPSILPSLLASLIGLGFARIKRKSPRLQN